MQICWLWQKIPCSGPEEKSFQQFLDSVQYTSNGILRYEHIFGPGFVSTGGIKTTEEFVKSLDLKAGSKVLDVGCGIAGGGFYMAEKICLHEGGLVPGNYIQPGKLWRSMSEKDQEQTVQNIAGHIQGAKDFIIKRQLEVFRKTDAGLTSKVEQALEKKKKSPNPYTMVV
ncbi:unnamed protein product [Calypogeia fissa]